MVLCDFITEISFIFLYSETHKQSRNYQVIIWHYHLAFVSSVVKLFRTPAFYLNNQRKRRMIDMKKCIKKWLRPILFTLAGALTGLGYYVLVGCSTGSCAITSSPINSMLYMGLIGWLLSNALGSCCFSKNCNR